MKVTRKLYSLKSCIFKTLLCQHYLYAVVCILRVEEFFILRNSLNVGIPNLLVYYEFREM